MPNYYNPYNFYPASYMQNMYGNMGYAPQAQAMTPQQSFATQQGPKMMEWVEGEVGAKAFQMPNGWPANSPIPLWDSTDTVIYLKSWGPMGIPNPMQKIRYEMPEQQNQALLTGGNSAQGGNSGANAPDMSQFVTKHDLEQMKNELKSVIGQSNNRYNQNGSNNGQNRGGDK